MNWIDRSMLEAWTKLSFSELWQRIFNGVLCFERHNNIQDWIFITRQAESSGNRRILLEREKTVEKIRNYREMVENSNKFSILYNRAEGLKAIIEENDTKQAKEEKCRFELQKIQLQKDIFQLEKTIVWRELLENRSDQLLDTLNDLEQMRIIFQNKHFENFEPLSDDTNYKSFTENLSQNVISYHRILKEYQKTCEKCMSAEKDILHYKCLIENEQSKITFVNLFESDDREGFQSYMKSFETLLPVFDDSLNIYKQNLLQLNVELMDFLKENALEKLIEKLQNEVCLVTNAKNNVKNITDDISACLTELR